MRIDYRTRLDEAVSLADIFEVVKTLVEESMNKRRGGLMLGMEVAGEGKPIVESCLENHVIVNCTAGNVIRIVPPLIISKEEIDIVVAALDKALAAC